MTAEVPAAVFCLKSASGEAAPPELVSALQAAGNPLRARSGQLLVAEGARSDDVYIILSGKLRVTIYSADGREVIMRDLGLGEMFGDLSAVDNGRRSASILAVEESRLLILKGRDFRTQVFSTPAAAAWFATHLVHQVRMLTERVFELSTLNVRSRLHCQLLRLCALAGVSGNSATIEPSPTHEVLATMIGSHREAVTREISYLVTAGIVEQGRRRLVVTDLGKLTNLVRRVMGDHRDETPIG